jgi:UDP:flavonoid glycosyltransferase YjiC (YdhE family)
MRVVVACVPQTGNLFPLLPLAEALAAHGDVVVVASGADAGDAVRARGLAFRETGPPFADWFGALSSRTRGMPGHGLPPDRVERYFLPRLFGEVGTALVVDDLLHAVTEHRADVVIFDPVMFAAPLVAAKLGVRPVQHTVGPVYDDLTLELAADAVSPIWQEFGLAVPPAAGMYDGTTLAICPPSLDPAAAERPGVTLLRPVPLPLPEHPQLPCDFADPGRPLVYLTLGTFSNNVELFRLVIDALRDEPVNLLVTIGRDHEPSALGETSPNVHVAQFIPQADVLPHCTLAVHHAGAGTTFGILAHALPSVVLPQSADNFTIGARLASAGVAVSVMPADVTADAVRTAVRTVLAQPSYSESARRVADEIAAMPPPADVAARLVRRR